MLWDYCTQLICGDGNYFAFGPSASAGDSFFFRILSKPPISKSSLKTLRISIFRLIITVILLDLQHDDNLLVQPNEIVVQHADTIYQGYECGVGFTEHRFDFCGGPLPYIKNQISHAASGNYGESVFVDQGHNVHVMLPHLQRHLA